MKYTKHFGKVVLWFSIFSLIFFIYGFVTEVRVGHKFLYFMLTLSLFFKLLKVLFEWYHYAGLPKIKPHEPPIKPKKVYKVDLLTTSFPEEPFEMIEETLRAMVAVKYPHKNYLCDEGNDPALKKLCSELGVIHVTRKTRENAKAGNINNALKQSDGEICVILDPDHTPFPEFLDYVVHYFDNPEIGYVQVVQAYKNQSESFIAQASAEQTYTFYGPYMQAMGRFGTAQAIGANCTFRRAALDSIGGHAPGLTEDMHTSMLLHAKGWKSIYVSEILSRGLVPSSLSAYYKQQLKWSRGTFDLWFKLFPKLSNKFTWKQNIHYGLIPMYYLFGLIGLIDITVPIISLVSGQYPWLLNPMVFFSFLTPLFLFSLIYRFYAQNWLNDPEERGLHLLGGILRAGTWWVFILGFIYTLFNKKVPYLPTPKKHDLKGEFLLGFPNLAVSLISLFAIIYGLNRDWQPYSFIMAGFALVNSIIFFLAFAIGQSKWVYELKKLRKWINGLKFFKNHNFSYLSLSKKGMYFISIFLILATIFLTVNSIENKIFTNIDAIKNKEVGGFYTGIYLPSIDNYFDIEKLVLTEKQANHSWSIISTYLAWGDIPLPEESWKSMIEHGSIPMITWEPWTNLFSEYQNHPDLSNNKKVFFYILEGYFDDYIDQMAISLRSLDAPVFLRFAHEMENLMYPWSKSGENTADEFKNAWIYIHNRFSDLGAQNVSWVWNPWSVNGMEEYFPFGYQNSTTEYVDWVAFTGLNYAMANPAQKILSFEEIYSPFKNKMKELSMDLPVMISEFGSTSYGVDVKEWNANSIKIISEKYTEIKSFIFFYSNQDKNWISDWRPNPNDQFIDWTFDLKGISTSLELFNQVEIPNFSNRNPNISKTNYKIVQGSFGDFSWIVNGSPYYIQGVFYNTGQDDSKGFNPLTRKQLENDFGLIKQMGANTISRSNPSGYDRNIIKVSEEYGLNLIMGFLFNPDVDYLKDKRELKKYELEVLNFVKKHKEKKNIIAWQFGNETWSKMNEFFNKPYLTMNRRAYLDFIESLTQKIHEIDKDRPVISSEKQYQNMLPTALYEYDKYVPSIDLLGINSFYEENIKELQFLISEYDTSRPYFINEFGPKGYWDYDKGDLINDTVPIEVSSLNKAKWYENQWNEYIEKYKGYNLGGIAYAWKDNFQGSATWNGITDYKGRKKPTYYHLKRAWTNFQFKENHFPDIVIAGNWYLNAPGQSIWLTAAIINDYNGKLNFEWEVLEDGSFKKYGAISGYKNNRKVVEVKMPKSKSTYRVYVYATDSAGNVITASRPLLYQ